MKDLLIWISIGVLAFGFASAFTMIALSKRTVDRLRITIPTSGMLLMNLGWVIPWLSGSAVGPGHRALMIAGLVILLLGLVLNAREHRG